MAYHYAPNVRNTRLSVHCSVSLTGSLAAALQVSKCRRVQKSSSTAKFNETPEPEGPFTGFTGYASHRSTENVFVTDRIQMRRDAMFHSIASGSAADHILISCIAREGEILNSLRRNLPNVIRCVAHPPLLVH
jgi:hypothetical protein